MHALIDNGAKLRVPVSGKGFKDFSVKKKTSMPIMGYKAYNKWSSGLMDKVSTSQPRDRGFKPQTGHDHDTSYDTSTGCLQETDSRVI